MIAYSSLGASRIIPYSSAALAFFLNNPNYIKPQRTTNFIKVMIGDGLITAEHDSHKRQRRILTPAFAVAHIKAITPHFWTKANQLAEKWEELCQAPPEEGIEVTNWTSRATLDVIGLAGTNSQERY
jgi:cytochrome P450